MQGEDELQGSKWDGKGGKGLSYMHGERKKEMKIGKRNKREGTKQERRRENETKKLNKKKQRRGICREKRE